MIRHEHPLQVEWEYYEENNQEYLSMFPGRFVLIKGKKLVGVYTDRSSAYADGLRMLGNVPMLIHQVVIEETIESATWLTRRG